MKVSENIDMPDRKSSKRIIFLIALLICACFPFTPSAFSDLNIAFDASDRGDYKTALREFKADGSPKAHYYLGYMYENGIGVNISYKEALMWYRSSASKGYTDAQYAIWQLYEILFDKGVHNLLSHSESKKWGEEAAKGYQKLAQQGNAKAMYRLGTFYDPGIGITGKEKDEAIKWFQKSAELGYAEAQTSIAMAYDFGDGVQQNDQLSVSWFLKAAKGGNGYAQFEIGRRYAWAKGVNRDYVLSYMWLTLAAERGYDSLNWCNKNVKPNMTLEQITKSENLAKTWKKKK